MTKVTMTGVTLEHDEFTAVIRYLAEEIDVRASLIQSPLDDLKPLRAAACRLLNFTQGVPGAKDDAR